jgi:predicted 2-oxoglutarate/Fe(II)-dependent dioxygenase YbiX
MTHKDDVDGLDRVSGCVVFLNDDYEGGEPFYPYYDKMVKPKAGMVYAHSSDEDHLHGVTQIKNKARYTISITWTKNKDKFSYPDHFSDSKVMNQPLQ